MKLKTIFSMLLAATLLLAGFQACKQANLKPEGLQMNNNLQGAGCSASDFAYFGEAHNNSLDSIHRLPDLQVQATGSKINSENSSQLIYSEGIRCATAYQQAHPNRPIFLNPNFQNNLPYNIYQDFGSYEKYKNRVEQIISSNRFTQEQRPLLNQLFTAVDTCTTEKTFKVQILSVENQICQLPASQRAEMFRILSVAKSSANYWFNDENFDKWKNLLDIPQIQTHQRGLPRWAKACIKFVGADIGGALFGGLGGAISGSGKALVEILIEEAIVAAISGGN